jgi:hypothetical protein
MAIGYIRCIEGGVDRDAGAGALGERRGESLADLPGPVDVGLEGDRPLRAADRRKHRREDLVAVLQVDDDRRTLTAWPTTIAAPGRRR